MEKLEVTSEKWKLNVKDYLRGLLISVGTAVGFIAQSTIDAMIDGKVVQFNWKSIEMAALGAGIAYLAKNFLQPAQVKKTVTKEELAEIKNITIETKEAAK